MVRYIQYRFMIGHIQTTQAYIGRYDDKTGSKACPIEKKATARGKEKEGI